jgi:hypothetical protein
MADGKDPEAPKIIIDSDWKSQARAEKERLSERVQPAKPAPAGAAAATAGEDEPSEPGIQDIVSLLMTQALTYMGAFPDPRTGRAVVSLEMAHVFIELLRVLEEKTKGNLDAKEQQVLSRVLNELRMEYVEMSKYLERAIAEGKVKQVASNPGGVVTPPPGPMPGGPMFKG